MSRTNGLPARCGLTDCAASMLDAAVTAEMTMSASRTASAAEPAQRAPLAAAACRRALPCACGNRMSHADMRSTPASRSPAAIAWPASPKPMKEMAGLPFGIVKFPCSRLSPANDMAVSAHSPQCQPADRALAAGCLNEPSVLPRPIGTGAGAHRRPERGGRSRLPHGLCAKCPRGGRCGGCACRARRAARPARRRHRQHQGFVRRRW